MQSNPFDISFGKKPQESIARIRQSKEILDAFMAEPIVQQVYMITGVRGSGKTVLMNSIANRLEEEKDWIVVRLNPDRDLLLSMGAKLSGDQRCAEVFRLAKLNLSAFGFGVSIEGVPPINDIEAVLERMLKSLKKQRKRVLVTIDEVTNNPQIRTFCSSFQIFIGQELPVFLLMTGLYENIYSLQNEKNLTFLYRAPKITMDPLSISMIAARYESVFSVSREEGLKMANLTKGYPFAFQALGYSVWRSPDDENHYMNDYRQILEEFVYEKIWSGLSAKDKRIVGGIAHCPDGKISKIVAYLKLKKDEINQYRRRLIHKGIVNGDEYGYLTFALPLFDVFVQDKTAMQNETWK